MASRKSKLHSKQTKKSVLRFLIAMAIVFLAIPQERALSDSQLPQKENSAASQEGDLSDRLSKRNDEGEIFFKAESSKVIGLDSEQMLDVLAKVNVVAKSITQEYEIGGGATLVLYILRYFSEIGEFELSQENLSELLDNFEGAFSPRVYNELNDAIKQIRRVKFGKREGKLFTQFFSIQPIKGIVIESNEIIENPKSSITVFKKFVLEEGGMLFFDDVSTTEQKNQVREFVKSSVQLLGLIEMDFLTESLGHIDADITKAIDDHLDRGDNPTRAMSIEMRGVHLMTETSTALKQIKFNIDQVYTLPGIGLEGSPISSLVFGAKAKFLNLKVSIDQ